MKPKTVGKIIALGNQRWRLNENNKWDVLMYGSFRPNQIGLHWEWVCVDIEKVPKKILDSANV